MPGFHLGCNDDDSSILLLFVDMLLRPSRARAIPRVMTCEGKTMVDQMDIEMEMEMIQSSSHHISHTHVMCTSICVH